MFRPLRQGEIVFNEWADGPAPKLIKKPRKKSKQKAWHSYYNWWRHQMFVDIWMSSDCSMPFQRSQEFQVCQIINNDPVD